MSAPLVVKELRTRWVGAAIASVAIALFTLGGMAVYRDIDLSLYTDLPEAMRVLMGIPADADAASLTYNVMLGTMASLAVAGLAIAIGSGAIAGEERSGTLGILLANPSSRRRVLVSKATSLVLLVAAMSLIVWAGGLAAPELLGVDVGGTQIGATVLHLAANALLWGMLALAIGSWTGSTVAASGAAGGAMVASFVAVGLLPLIDVLQGAVKVVPWHYFDGSQPLRNGVSGGHLAVQLSGAAVMVALATIGFDRRDLRTRSAGESIADRLRANPLTAKVADRLAGSARVSGLGIKAASEHQGLLFIVAGLMFSTMGLLMGPVYSFIDDSLSEFSADLPEALLAIVGGADLSTPAGWFEAETFSLMAPIAVILVALVVGGRGLALDESGGTLGLLLANPVRRSRVVLSRAGAMAAYAAVVGAATFAGTAAGSLLAGLDISIANLAATSLLLTLLGLVFGGLALLVSAATGRAGLATSVTIGAALAFQLAQGFLPLSDRLAGYAKLSPFHYYLGSDPLNNGMAWGHGAVLAALAAGLVVLAVETFARRDLRRQ
jgi:ABC-2 type transport system permease protein